MSSLLVNNYKSSASDTAEDVYTDPGTGNGTIIQSVTVANNTGVNRRYRMYITSIAESPTDPIIPYTTVVWDLTDEGLPVINQIVPAGGKLWFESDLADSLSLFVTGKAV